MRVNDIPARLLLGPGPSPVSERVLAAMAHPTVGHLDSAFLELMDEVKDKLRIVFGTANEMTFPVFATGSAGMEAALANVLEPGDTAIVGVNGVFGTRLAEMARRMGAKVVPVKADWGRIVPEGVMLETHARYPEARVLALVHAETSTGPWQPLEGVGRALPTRSWIDSERGGSSTRVMASPALRTALAATYLWLGSGCVVAIPDPPPSLPGPVLRADHLAFLEGGRGPVLTEPPEVVRDPILDSRWARHPILAQSRQRWIDRWTGAGARDFQVYLSRMELYREVVDREIAARGLPRSLRYLPIVESGYAPSARSSAAAVGLWQFMSGTARDVGLTVSPLLDERRDPVRSTPKALDVLSEHRERFGSWYVALAAYNAGPARVSRILRRRAPLAPRGDSLFLFLVLYESLPAETRDFIPKLLAASTLAESPERYGFKVPSTTPLRFEEVTVPDATSVDVIAEASDSRQESIEALNPQLLRGFTPPDRETIIRVPEGRGLVFEGNYAQIPPERRVSFLEHRVQSGETFSHIALQYNVGVSLLQAANPGIQPRRLQIGQWVVVPRAQRTGERGRRESGLPRDQFPFSAMICCTAASPLSVHSGSSSPLAMRAPR